jgi:hypothetical protein
MRSFIEGYGAHKELHGRWRPLPVTGEARRTERARLRHLHDETEALPCKYCAGVRTASGARTGMGDLRASGFRGVQHAKCACDDVLTLVMA